MNESESTLKREQSQPKKRAWVTPTFEQVPLKDALSGIGLDDNTDIATDSS